MNASDIRALVTKGESSTLELKATVPPPDIIARHISSLANTDGGLLLFGVQEPHKFVGVDEALTRSAIDQARQLLLGDVNLQLEFVPVDGRTVGVLSVQRSDGIVATAGGYFGRTGDRTRPLRAEEISDRLITSQSPDKAIAELSRAVARQTETIERLRADFARANSLWRKVAIGVVGAAIGAILKVLGEHLWP